MATLRAVRRELSPEELRISSIANVETGELLPEKAQNLIDQGWQLTQKIKALELELNDVKTRLKAQYGALKAICPGEFSFNLTPTAKLEVKDAERLKMQLQSRFDDLVSTRTSYTLSDKLKEMLLDADSPTGQECREAVEIKESATLVWRAI